ncbi:MAG: hypothetical protein HQ528_07630 [Candidatus Marinimicrobia bacterium]|nr:hypothetical protein [Candidatus Neomarinimicrobiota bacterium]
MSPHYSSSKFSQLILIGLMLIIISISSVSALGSGAIVHQPIYQHSPTEPLIIYTMVESNINIENVRLLFRPTGEVGYVEIYMDLYDDLWRGEIYRSYLAVPELEYFIAATLADGTILTLPEIDAEVAPFQINLSGSGPASVAGGRAQTADGRQFVEGEEILVFSPDPGSIVPYDDIFIAASLYNVEDVDPASIKLLVDNRDVTGSSEISADFVAYAPYSMSPGKHFVQIELNNLAGNPLPGRSWSFKVVKKTREVIEREFSYRGKINGSYSRDPQGEGNYLDIFKTKASFTGDWRWLKFKADVKITSDEDIYKQPKNRFGLSFNVGKNMALNFGDFSSRLSKYTMDGKRIRGFNADLKWGILKLQVVKGELLREVQGRPDADMAYNYNVIEVKDSTGTSLSYRLDRKGYTFKRDIFSSRISFGRGKIFQMGFNYLKAKDDISSVMKNIADARITVDDTTYYSADSLFSAQMPGGIYTYNEFVGLGSSQTGLLVEVVRPDDKNWGGDRPQDNIVIGSDIKINTRDRRLSFEAGWAFSMLNTDIWDGAISKADIDILLDDSTDGFVMRTYDADGNVVDQGIDLAAIPIDPADYEKYFTISQNMIPLVPIDIDSTQLADHLFRAIGRMPSLAYNYKIMANYFDNRVTLEYNRVGPNFNSLGNPYLQSDIREFIVSDRVKLLQNKLFVGATYRRQDNATTRIVSNKMTTNTMTLNVGVYPGADYPTFNFKLSSKSRFNDLAYQDTTGYDSVYVVMGTDTTRDLTGYHLQDRRLDENTPNITFGVNYRVNFMDMSHNLMLNYSKLEKVDQIGDRYEPGSAPYLVDTFNDTTFLDTTFTSSNMVSDVTTISVVTQYTIPLKTTLVLSLNNRTTATEKQGITGVNLNASYDLFGGGLKLNSGFGYTSGAGASEFSRFNIRGGVSYRIMESLFLRTSLDYRGTKSDGENEGAIIMRADLNYSF